MGWNPGIFNCWFVRICFLWLFVFSAKAASPADSASYYIKKGKQALQRYYDQELVYALQINPDESIYSEEAGYFGKPEHPVIDAGAVDSIAAYWIKAQSFTDDPTISFSLCKLYASSLNVELLFSLFEQLKEAHADDNDLPFLLARYAEVLEERQAHEAVVLCYEKLIDMFPHKAGLYNDLANTYFRQGKMDSAIVMADRAMQLGPEKRICRSAILIYAINEKDKKVQSAANTLSTITETPEKQVITSLIEALHQKTSWQKPLLELNQLSDNRSDALEQMLAMLKDEAFMWEYDDYMMLRKLSLGDEYRLYLHRIFHDRYPEQIEPLFYYAEVMAYYKRYEKACSLFEQHSTILATHHYHSRYMYAWAWSLYAAGHHEQAKEKWLLLKEHDDYRIATAAAYFLAIIYLEEGEKKAAKEMILLAKPYFNETKYGMYRMNLYNREF